MAIKKATASATTKVVTAAIAAAGGFWIFKKFIQPKLKGAGGETAQQKSNDVIDRIKQEQAAQAAAEAKRKANERIIQQSTSIANPNSFAGKVARIQTILGVAVDGVPGRVTNGAYQKRFGLDRGEIGVVNVSYYLDKAESDTKFLQL